MENKILNPVDELIRDVDLHNRSGDIRNLLKVVKIYKEALEKIYSLKLLHSTPEEIEWMRDDAWYAEIQARQIAVKGVSV